MIKKILIYTGITLVLIVGILAGNLFIFNRIADHISSGDPIPDYERERSAVLVIDVQEATTGTVSLNQEYRDQAEPLIRHINLLASIADTSSIPVIYITNIVTNPLINLLNNTMASGSVGAKPDQRLKIHSSYIITKKKNDAFTNPELDRLLYELKVNHLYITGLDASYCVNCTLRGALNREYRVTIIDDAVISAPENQKTEMFNQFRELGVSFTSMADFPTMD